MFKLKKININHLQTARSFKFITGLALASFIVASPYLFYLYRIPQEGAQEWYVLGVKIKASGFYDVSSYLHAVFTKLALVFLTSISFLKIQSWWKWTLLIPLIMFLFQLFSVLNKNWKVFDEYSFYYSLIPTLPIVGVLIYSTLKINDKINHLDLLDQIDAEIEKVKSTVE